MICKLNLIFCRDGSCGGVGSNAADAADGDGVDDDIEGPPPFNVSKKYKSPLFSAVPLSPTS